VILLTGGAGFVGRAALAALLRRDAAVRVLTHRRAVGGGSERVSGDLAQPATLHGACDGAAVVVHLASAIDEDEDVCAAVNVRGTDALLAEARRAGVSRIVYLSTAAVYGTGPHRGIPEDGVRPEPVSATSRSRLLAERTVLAAGGIVLRPMLVHGAGDTWFVPALARALSRTPVTVDGGRARLSLVAVEDLAEVIATIALAPEPPPLDVYHVNHPQPVTVGELHSALSEHLDVPAPVADVDLEAALAVVGADPRRARQLALVALDHFYESSTVWRHTGLTPGGFRERLAGHVPWYRRHLGL
jgi:nucleoside-diphosphate-sugar epimerase